MRIAPCYSHTSMQVGTGEDEDDEAKEATLIASRKKAQWPVPKSGVDNSNKVSLPTLILLSRA